ncbi:MAG: NUDIX domain-containing protein [Nocardioidaceae bacterium]|nr:NUDIX domain-containing protein [Nocardioidaceae bacterium]
MHRQRFDATDALKERIRAIAAGDLEAAVPRPASTVVLLRDGATGPEVYLLLRHRGMAFAAGVHVFPGGGVDARDAEPLPGWHGPDAAWWGEHLGCDAASAHALVVAAVRETFEESGVLLAGTDGSHVVPDTTGEEWEAHRLALVDHDQSLAQVLSAHDLVLRADLLSPWAHWITPEVEPRRYDTFFFVAALPEGQRTRDVSTESEQVRWIPLAEVDGDLAMMPPTRITCEQLGAHASVADARTAAVGRPVPVVAPRMVLESDDVYLVRDEVQEER